jgi:hypothetical protein
MLKALKSYTRAYNTYLNHQVTIEIVNEFNPKSTTPDTFF